MEQLFRGRFLDEAFRYANGQERIDLQRARARQKLDNLKLYHERTKLENYKMKLDMIVNQVIFPSILVLGLPVAFLCFVCFLAVPVGMLFLSVSLSYQNDQFFGLKRVYIFLFEMLLAIGRTYIDIMGPNPADLFWLFRFWYYQFYILLSAHDLITASDMCYPLKLHEYYFNASALVLKLK